MIGKWLEQRTDAELDRVLVGRLGRAKVFLNADGSGCLLAHAFNRQVCEFALLCANEHKLSACDA